MSRAVLVAGACAGLLCAGAASGQGPDRAAIVNETYQEVYCRPPTSDELTYWAGRPDWTTRAHLIARHRWFIYENRSAQDEVIRNAYRDVFHREPTEAEQIRSRPEVRQGLTCAGLVNARRDSLAGQSATSR